MDWNLKNLAIRSWSSLGNISYLLNQVKIHFPLLDHKFDCWIPLQKRRWNMGNWIRRFSNQVVGSRWNRDEWFIVDFFTLLMALFTSQFFQRFYRFLPIYWWFLFWLFFIPSSFRLQILCRRLSISQNFKSCSQVLEVFGRETKILVAIINQCF